MEKKTWLIIFLLFFIFATFGVYWAARKLSRQVVELTAYDDYLNVQWIKRPLFSVKKDQQILWKDMDSFVYERMFRYDYQLRINMKTGRRIRFLEDGYKLKSSRDLSSFYYFLKKKSAALAIAFRNEQEQTPLREDKPFLYTTPGKILSVLFIITMIVVVIFMPMDNEDRTLFEWQFRIIFIGILAMAGIVFYLFSRKKRKKVPVKRVAKKKDKK